jgi:pyruvate,water dikinase
VKADRGGSGDGFDTTARPGQRWTTAGVAEMLPGRLPPLIWEVNRRLVEEGLRQHLDRLHVLPTDIDDQGGFLGRFRGRAAVRLDLVEAVTALPGGDASEVEAQYFGGSGEPATRRRRVGWRAARRGMVASRERSEAQIEAATVDWAISLVAARAEDVVSLDDVGLRRRRDRLVDLAGRTVAAEIAVSASAVVAYRQLERSLAKHTGGPEAARWAQRLTSAAGRPPHRRDGASRAVLAGPTWSELPAIEPEEASAPGAPALEGSWDDLLGELREQPGWGSMRVLTGQLVDLRLLVLRRLVEDAVELLSQRDRTKAAMLLLGGSIRLVHLELGRRLVAEGRLREPDEVDWLSEAELEGRAPFPTPSEITRRRDWLRAQRSRPLPPTWDGQPPAVADDPPVVGLRAGGELHGRPIAPGRRIGIVRVVEAAASTAVEPGDVVVARTTDPSWTPVLLQAGALVLEQGGPLSHAAVLARELGIPAVGDVAGATAVLTTSSRVLVDGDTGSVVVQPDDGPTTAADGELGVHR